MVNRNIALLVVLDHCVNLYRVLGQRPLCGCFPADAWRWQLIPDKLAFRSSAGRDTVLADSCGIGCAMYQFVPVMTAALPRRPSALTTTTTASATPS